MTEELRRSRQRRFETQVQHSGHVDDEAFQDAWRNIQADLKAAKLKLRGAERHLTPIRPRVRQLLKDQGVARRAFGSAEQSIEARGLTAVFEKLIQRRGRREDLTAIRDGLTAYLAKWLADSEYARGSAELEGGEAAERTLARQVQELEGRIEQVFDLYDGL